jgi:hypothetical protein
VDLGRPNLVAAGRFDALLRELITFGLVDRTGGDEAEWHLHQLVQRRLDTLAAPAPPVDKLLYFGHRCAACNEHRPTKLVSGRYVCEACLVVGTQPPAPVSHLSERSA